MSRPGGGFGGANVAPGQKPLDFKTTVRRIARLLIAEPVTIAVVMALSVSSVGLGVVGPKIIGRAVDRITAGYLASLRHTGGIDFDSVGRILLLALGVYLLSSLLMWIQSYLLAGVVQRAMQELRAQIETKMHRLPLSYIDAQPRGDLLSRVTNDIDNVGQTLTQTMGQLLVNGMTVIGVLIMMLVVSPLLTLVAMVTIPLTVFVTGAVMKRSQKQFIAQWKHTGTLNAQVEETFAGHELVTVFGRRREVGQRFDEHNDALAQAAFGAQFASGLIMPINMFIGNLQYVVVCVVGALRVGSGAMTLGDVVAFIQYTRQFTMPLTQLATMANQVQSGVASAERVFEILDAPEQSADGTAELPEPPLGRVEFDSVTFGYKADTPLIEDLNLVAEPGRTVAIVGPTGAGKTTLVNLLMRFYDLDGGTIDLDGRDIAQVPRGAVRSRIGMVLQDAWLFEGTIAENIRYGRPDATDEELLTAARAAYVDRFVHALPDGYETVLDETAGALSTGEKQLVTIARAFLADPAILILDEATSSVDTRTEVLLQEAMGALRRDRTSFVIAHRLSTIRDADIIVVMEHGRIVEQGDHDSLLEARGAYYRLYQSQFEGAFLDEEEQAGSAV